MERREDPRDREDLFRSFCDALRIKLRDEKKKLRDEKVNAFKATLRAMGVDSVVDWTWRRVLDELAKDVETTNPDKDGDGGFEPSTDRSSWRRTRNTPTSSRGRTRSWRGRRRRRVCARSAGAATRS